MSSASSTTSVAPSGNHAVPRGPARIAAGVTTIGMTIGLLLSAADTADAQAAPRASRNGFELLASSGALVPTGAQRDALNDAPLSTAQLSYVVRSRLAVTTTVGWARSRDLVAAGDPKLSVFTYDLGVETRASRSPARSRQRGSTPHRDRSPRPVSTAVTRRVAAISLASRR